MQALAHATAPRQPLALIAAHRFLGELDVAAGREQDALTHLDTALRLVETCAAPFERALTLTALAELHATNGKRTEARRLLHEVRAIGTALGAKPLLARVDALMDTLVTAAPVAPARRFGVSAYPGGLTMREVDVLRLIAAGQTDREIAETLALSTRTVSNYVLHILNKTDAPNRTAAAAFAFRHGLA